jgi:hypothetical protein
MRSFCVMFGPKGRRRSIVVRAANAHLAALLAHNELASGLFGIHNAIDWLHNQREQGNVSVEER